jgi:hypothetical protein
MLEIFKRPPFVGIIAFMSVLAVQPLGHILMIVMEKYIPEGETWLGPVFDVAPVIPEGYENFFLIENNLYWSAFWMGLVGFIIILWGIRKGTEVAGTWAGFVGATFMWTGWTEFGIHFYARFYGVKSMCKGLTEGAPNYYDFVCAENPATKPEYFLMESSIGFLVMVMVFFTLNKETRCNMFRWIQRNVFFAGKPSPGFTRNFGNIVACETFMILWFCYVWLMVIYNEDLFGETHWVTYGSFVLMLVWGLYLMQRLIRYKRVTNALRYAIPTAIIFWNALEIAGRWNWFGEYWIHPWDYPIASGLTVVAVIAFLLISLKSAVDKTKQVGET